MLACGSVDDGKSTLIGRLLFECGTIPDDVMAALERDSKRFGTVQGGTDYALLVDGLSAERDQGITIDVAYRFFETPRRRFILADAPGHEQYTRNMVTGASASDVAVLLVDARKGLLVQTRRHAAIASLLGIRQLVLAVNKMDLVGFEQSVFDKIVTDFYALLGKLGPLAVTAIPVCARDGDNVTAPSTRMPWYSGTTLLTALEGAEPTSHVAERAFRMPVQLVARPDHTFRGYAGTVATGTIRPGAAVVNAMSGVEAKVARIVTMDGDLAEASPGRAVTLVLDREIDVSRGDVLAVAPPPALADQVTAWVVWMDETPLFRGRAYQVMLGARSVTGTITEIASRLDVDTLAEVPVRELGLNEIGKVTISLAQRLPCERYAVSRELGGFILIDRLTRNTVGAGMVTDLRAGASNIHWQRLDVDKHVRAGLMGQKPVVLWFTGLSASGKSTIANLVEKALHAQGRHTMSLDGDNVRHALNRDLGFSEADRVENIRRVAEVSKLFVEAGLIVLVSFISPYRAERMLARDCVEEGEFLEIFVDTPVDECRRRDPKGLYRRADAGQIRNFTGVDAPYEEPLDPELRLPTLSARRRFWRSRWWRSCGGGGSLDRASPNPLPQGEGSMQYSPSPCGRGLGGGGPTRAPRRRNPRLPGLRRAPSSRPTSGVPCLDDRAPADRQPGAGHQGAFDGPVLQRPLGRPPARLAADGSRHLLRRKPRRHRADGLLLSRTPAERRRRAAAAGMRAALAGPAARADAGYPPDAAGGDLCPGARAGPRRDDRAGARLPRASAAILPAAASVLAHHRLGATQSLVRRGRTAGIARGCDDCAWRLMTIAGTVDADVANDRHDGARDEWRSGDWRRQLSVRSACKRNKTL